MIIKLGIVIIVIIIAVGIFMFPASLFNSLRKGKTASTKTVLKDKKIKPIVVHDTIKPPATSEVMHAWQDSDNIITLYFNPAINKGIKLTDNLIKIKSSKDENVQILKITPLQIEKGKCNLFSIELESSLSVSELNFVEYPSALKAQIIPRKILNDKKFYYTGNDLGSIYNNKETSFRLWAPTAKSVEVLLYDFYNNDVSNYLKKTTLSKDEKGTWKTVVKDDLKNKYYLYNVTLYVDGKETTYLVADPYSRASAVNCSKSLIFDPEDVDKAVPIWNQENKYVSLNNNVDAVIYEIHLRDFTIAPSSGVKEQYKGKYLGLTQYNTKTKDNLSTGLDDLMDLGITHLHILPTYDYGSGDEAEMNNSYTWYNWGYDPVLYNNIEGSYSTYPNGIIRQIEYKKMVQTLHNNDIGVVFDAVFNHTFQTANGKFSIFDKIVPYYYYRVENNGDYSNGSGCGNDVATERPMVRKFIVDSVKYFTKEYHIDGFRFDLMGLIDKQTMLDVYAAVKIINPDAIIYGEGWKMPTMLPESDCMTQANVGNSGIAAFNDGIRDNLKGNVFVATAKGFVQNAQPMTGIDRLKSQIMGQSTGRAKKSIPVDSPNATVNYVSCHDNLCLWDKLKASDPKADSDKLKKMDMLAFGAIITSQGIPFFPEGEDFGRTKHGNDNSYNNNDPSVNPIDWLLKAENIDMYKFYKGMIKLRKEHPAFRMTSKNLVDEHLQFISGTPKDLIAYVLKDNANVDSWKNILVVLNSSPDPKTIKLVGQWNVVAFSNKAGTETIKTVYDDITVPGISILVAHTESNIVSYEY